MSGSQNWFKRADLSCCQTCGSSFRNQQVLVRLESDSAYELVEASRVLLLAGESQTLIAQARTVKLQGRVLNQAGEAVAGAQVQIADKQLATGLDGSFALALRADLAETERVLTVVAAGYSAWRGTFVLDSNPLIVQLQP